MRFIDMFCGIGGFRLGLEQAGSQIQQGKQEEQRGQDRDNLSRRGNSGFSERPNGQPAEFHCVWANDNDKYACQIYRRHFGEVTEADIKTVDASAIPDHELLCAGFPCQSFSKAGKRRGFEDTRGTLFFDICRVLRAKRPRLLFLENVRGLLSADEGRTFLIILQSLDELGYDCQWQVLNSKDYGVPQNRERVFIIGHLRGQPRPKVFPLGEAGQLNETMELTGEPTTGCLRARGEEDMHSGLNLVSEMEGIRRLTPIECERLQGFPDNWTAGISDAQRYKCLGNAVSVPVIEAIGRQLMEFNG